MRVAQEALTNVHRHANATRVDITLQVRDADFELEIRDDGQGMEAADSARRFPSPALGAGLRIMQARLHEMGGRFEIFSSLTGARRETVLLATFPSRAHRGGELENGRQAADQQRAGRTDCDSQIRTPTPGSDLRPRVSPDPDDNGALVDHEAYSDS